MKTKRILGAITAIAMSASAFAGLGCVASADEEWVYYVGSEDGAEDFSDYSNPDDIWSSDSTAGTFSTSASGNAHFGIAASDVYSSYVNTGYTQSIDGNVLSTSVRGKDTAKTTLTLPDKVTNGQFYFSSDMVNYSSTSYSAQQGMTLTFYDSSDAVVATMTTSYNTASIIALQGNTGSEIKTTGTTNVREGGYAFNFSIVIDLEEQYVSGTVDYYNASDSYAELSESLVSTSGATTSTISASNIAYVVLSFTGNANGNNFAYALDNTTVCAYTDTDVATYGYSIHYQLDGVDVAVVESSEPANTPVSAESKIKGTVTGCTDTVYYATVDVTDEEYQLTVTADSDNKLVIPVRAEYEYTVSVETESGDSIVAATTVKESDDSFTYSYPLYLTDDNHLVTAKCDDSVTEYTVTKTFDELVTDDENDGNTDNTVVYQIPYNTYEGTAYFYEGEEISGASTAYAATTFSGGTGRRGFQANAQNDVFTATEDGVYDVSMHLCTNRNAAYYVYLYVDGTQYGDACDLTNNYTASNAVVTDPVEIGIASGKTLAFAASDTQVVVDYILLEKVDPEIKTVTVATSDSIDDGTPLYEVGETSNYIEASGYTENVTTYIIKVANWATGLAIPTLTINDTTTLESTGNAADYVHARNSDGYNYFMIQTVGYDRAATATFNDKTFTVPTE